MLYFVDRQPRNPGGDEAVRKDTLEIKPTMGRPREASTESSTELGVEEQEGNWPFLYGLLHLLWTSLKSQKDPGVSCSGSIWQVFLVTLNTALIYTDWIIS